MCGGGLYNHSLNNLAVVQNTIVKIIFKKHHRYSTNQLYEEAGLFNIRQIYTYQCILWMRKNNNTANNLNQHHTRSVSTQNIVTPLCKKSHIQRFSFYLGPKLFNLLPPEIKSIINYNKFKKEVKKYISLHFMNFQCMFS